MDRLNLGVTIDERFDERRVGIPNDTVVKDWFLRQYLDEDYKTVGGESQKEVRKRVSQALYEILDKPENKGKFTALKKRTGKSASWFKEHGTPAQRKMATFALNARKWKHDDGGFIIPGQEDFVYNGPTYQQTLEQIAQDPKMRMAYNNMQAQIAKRENPAKEVYSFTLTYVPAK